MIDTHTHLTSLDDPETAICSAHRLGVTRLVTIGSSADELAGAERLAEHHPGVFFTAGLHPHDASSWSDAVANRIEAATANPRCVAVGETGLDFFRDRSPHDAQRRAFTAQLAIARDRAQPVVIHCRDATDECIAILAEQAPSVVILHCFAATERLDDCIQRGWYCSFAGNVTYPSAADLQDAARRVPDQLLLLETDAPYLAPAPHRGQRNEPALIMETLRYVADLRGVDTRVLAGLIDTNATRAYGLDTAGRA